MVSLWYSNLYRNFKKIIKIIHQNKLKNSNLMKHLHLTLIALLLSVASYALPSITGPTSLCLGTSITLSDATPGGTWSSSNPIIATISPATGVTTGVGAGTATIGYTDGVSTVTLVITVNPLPGPIAGTPAVCLGATTSLSDIGGGTWSSSNTAIATVGSLTAIVGGVLPGTSTIAYTIGATSCSATIIVTVDALPATISGVTTICSGGSTSLTDPVTGGYWSSSDATVATVDPFSGIVTGGSPGTATINYTTTCSIMTTLTVGSGLATISGATSVCLGGSTTLTDATGGGTWSSSNPTITSIDPITGVVTSLTPGLVTIIYSTGIGCNATTSFYVNSLPFSYTVSGGGTYCSGGTGVGVSIGLLGSTPSVNYQVYVGGVPVGAIYPGIGAPITFGPYTTPGVYTVIGFDATTGCMTTMTGSATITSAPGPALFTVVGGGAYCAGGAGDDIGLVGSDIGVTYQLYNGSATAGTATPGTGSSLDFGLFTAAGTYAVSAVDPSSGCSSTMPGSVAITVNPLPVSYSVTGGGSYCSGTSGLNIGLSGSNSGTNYQLYTGTSPVGSAIAGTGSSLDFGLHTAGTYLVVATNVATGCTNTMTGTAVITSVMLTPTVSIGLTPGGTICAGATITFSAVPVNGGTAPTYAWTVNGVAAGTSGAYTYIPVNGDIVGVTMTSSLPCALPLTVSSADALTVITPVITASSTSVCGGTDILIGGGGASYSWAPSTGLSCTLCDTTTVNPTATITYIVTGTDAYGCIGTASITANGNRISGHVAMGTATGSVRVWLIQYNPSDSSLTAIDSAMACDDGGMSYYEFDGKPAGSYLVKANLLGGTPGASGYISTYGVSSPIWSSATGLTHGSGTDTMHVDLIYGIVSPGPGFIGGLIVSGAGRGTTTDVPVAGLLVYLKDGVSGNILTYTYTNSLGQYSFSGLANSSYIIYPEDYHYYTTPAYLITLTPDNESVNSIDFKQHNAYGTITPYIVPQVVKPLSPDNGLNIYPNPTSSNLNVQWTGQAIGSANVVITDIIGHEVYTSVVNINTASGQTQIDLSRLTNGVYLVNIKSGNNNFNGKLTIQQ